MNTPTYLDIHALQTLPYSNVNRDDLGLPKVLEYGGAERTRVSSQSWKRAVRHQVEAKLADPAVRTRRIIGAVAERLTAQGWSSELAELAGRQVVAAAGKGIKLEPDKEGQLPSTSVLLYLPTKGLDELAQLAADHEQELQRISGQKNPKAVLPAEQVADILRSRNATINLFGRMLAELPGADVDGAVQFAHAFTVHGTEVETDFFTAVDDIRPADDHGSGHMNVGQFSAGTFYRYANVNIGTLLDNLEGDTATARELVSEFLAGFLATVPSGKQTATGAMTIPELVYVAVRGDRPISFAPAFEQPVTGTDGYSAKASTALSTYARRLHTLWGEDELHFSAHAGLDDSDETLSGLGRRKNSYPGLRAEAIEAAFGAEQ